MLDLKCREHTARVTWVVVVVVMVVHLAGAPHAKESEGAQSLSCPLERRRLLVVATTAAQTATRNMRNGFFSVCVCVWVHVVCACVVR